MSDKIDVMLSELLSDGSTFMADVVKRNTDPKGRLKNPSLYRRMQNDICASCHVRYKEKYPDTPFRIECSGIYSEIDYLEKQQQYLQDSPSEEPPPIESVDPNVLSIREIYDVVYWAKKHIVVKNDDGDLVPFEARWYQEETLLCTARHKVDRWGRGLGKTTCAVIEELHKALTKHNYEILVVCPADSQSEKWYNEINLQIENSPTIKDTLAQSKQQPFKTFRFYNGSVINIFTAGSASGRGANAVRSQNPRRIRVDEQDFLADKDWEAIDPLIQRFDKAKHNPSEYHGSSTPTGRREKFWEMCTQFNRYREFYFPITVHPDWDDDMAINCRIEAKTEDRFQHEYLAEFGDPAAGVFKSLHIDASLRRYSDVSHPSLRGYDTCSYNPSKRYFMGVDWNGEGTGTRIRIIEFDPESRMRRCVAKAAIDSEGRTALESMEAIVDLQKIWHCDEIYIDRGFGSVQDELLRKIGYESSDPDVRKLLDLKVIDFGANLVTNAIVPKRNPNLRAVPKGKEDEEQLERRTKPFMVEGAIMCFEHKLVEISDDDKLLEEQLRAYRVKNYSAHGYPSSYEVDGKCGDHDLDAFMLALLGIELKYGLFATKESYKRLASVSHVTTFGLTQQNFQSSEAVQQKRQLLGAPSRNQATSNEHEQYRIAHLLRGMNPGAIMIPIRGGQNGPIPSRTDVFRNKRGGRKPWQK